MLASDDDGETVGALSFSLATDIVELVILTTDATFLQTLRQALGSARRLWHVAAGDKVSDLLLAGQVGIVVLDVQALHDAASVFVSQIKRQFPDLVVVGAGYRDDETSLAGLISDGIVYRFIHKPMSPGRAKSFADAAVRKYDSQRRGSAAAASVAPAPPGKRLMLAGAAIAVLAAVMAVAWTLHHGSSAEIAPPQAAALGTPATAESPRLVHAAEALRDNRLTTPSGDNALELYLQELAHNPSNAAARAGLAEVHERLLARAENALLEERLDEAATEIETARRAGGESGRIALLSSQLAKARGQLRTKAARAQSRSQDTAPAPSPTDSAADRLTQLVSLGAERTRERSLLAPERDNAQFYVQEALRIDPGSAAAQAAEEAFAIALLSEAHAAIERHDFTHAAGLLEAASGIASPTNVENLQRLLATSRQQAEANASNKLLETAEDRLQQDQLIEPADDNAKYYLLSLRGIDPENAGLAPALQDLGMRLTVKARRALDLRQYEAARRWLDEAAGIGFSSVDSAAALRELQAAVQRQSFLSNVIDASHLSLIKSVTPVYPLKARQAATEGWVELDFTVAQNGEVKDIAVQGANPPGVFNGAAIDALSHWLYKPVLRDDQPDAQRARIRIRFALSQ